MKNKINSDNEIEVKQKTETKTKTNSNPKIKNTTAKKIAKTSRKQKIIRSLITLGIILGFLLAGYLVLKLTGVLDKINTVEDLKNFIARGGVWSYIIFVVIQFLQVTFIPIPAAITTIAGVLIFDPWVVLLLSLIAVMLGSIFAFWLGKKFGKKLVVWIAGKEDAEKWDKALSHGKYLFFLMMLFPGFPDDILCTVAGATPMSYKFFITTNLITRPIVFAGLVFFGSGSVIPFSGWGIPVWIVLIIFIAISFYISIKYKKQIEEKLVKWSDSIKHFFAKINKKIKSTNEPEPIKSKKLNNAHKTKVEESKSLDSDKE